MQHGTRFYRGRVVQPQKNGRINTITDTLTVRLTAILCFSLLYGGEGINFKRLVI